MAATSSTRKVATFGKRFVAQISSKSPSLSALVSRRSMHSSVYDKNVDEHVRAVVVPDDLIQPQSDKYWAPHPNTGVFGPATEGAGGERGFHTSPVNGGSESVLEQKAFFRPLEDLDKPQHA